MASASSKTRRIEIRVSDDERRLEEAAASELGQTLSEFVRQSARARAEEVMRDRGRIVLDDDAAARFLAALDEQAPPPPALSELFGRPDPFAR
ncbi:MAG: hypothetical protein QOI62_1503 [Solirubrobacteraceae bacterium]|jgi:uncharacterized protein (DUF1778 family)|nr:hypothetical protein [Solirubrobacteraceae bacterium]MEA2358243.1 hypothetical protein [Solirubrobacteraceae bacterium]